MQALPSPTHSLEQPATPTSTGSVAVMKTTLTVEGQGSEVKRSVLEMSLSTSESSDEEVEVTPISHLPKWTVGRSESDQHQAPPSPTAPTSAGGVVRAELTLKTTDNRPSSPQDLAPPHTSSPAPQNTKPPPVHHKPPSPPTSRPRPPASSHTPPSSPPPSSKPHPISAGTPPSHVISEGHSLRNQRGVAREEEPVEGGDSSTPTLQATPTSDQTRPLTSTPASGQTLLTTPTSDQSRLLAMTPGSGGNTRPETDTEDISQTSDTFSHLTPTTQDSR